jgi:predicted ABC-type ATPase
MLFVNADVIAAELSPSAPEAVALEAGRIMLRELASHVDAGRCFLLETTLSGRSYLPMIDAWRDSGYEVLLVFLRLDSPEDAIQRVAARVAQGGHHIPGDVVRRRFFSGLSNFHALYRHRVDAWQLFDAAHDAPRLLEEGP